MRYLASGWRKEANDDSPRNDVRDRDGDVVCVVWDDGDGSFTVQGWDAEWEQCDEADGHNFATLEEAEREVARRVAESESAHPFPSHTQYGCDDDTDDTAHVRTDGRGGFQALVGEHSLGIYPTFAEAMEAARESALSGEFDDTCDDCARAYGPHYGRCRCND